MSRRLAILLPTCLVVLYSAARAQDAAEATIGEVNRVLATPAESAERAPRLRVVTLQDGGAHSLGTDPSVLRQRILFVLLGASLVWLAVLLWVWLLRRKVADRTAALGLANVQLAAEIDERKRAQADLDRALVNERELGELKSRFVSLVSHEFRTPLGITMSAVDLLRHYHERLTPEKVAELLTDIHSATLRMSGLMEQVLLLGRVEAGKIGFQAAPLDLALLGEKLTDEMLSATSRKCPVVFRAADDLNGAQGDEALLRHILSNLISNAVKYSPEGAPVEFTARRDGEDAVFVVRDRGIGIPLADQPRLFEAFNRASNVGEIPGTGLGLLIVKRCVEMHHGVLTFDSREGEETTFTVRLRLFAPAAA